MRKNIYTLLSQNSRPVSVNQRRNQESAQKLRVIFHTGRNAGIIAWGGSAALPTCSKTEHNCGFLPLTSRRCFSLPGSKGRGMRKTVKTLPIRRRSGNPSESLPAAPPPVPVKPYLPADRLSDLVDLWLIDGDSKQHSLGTIKTRRGDMRRFMWWCEQSNVSEIDADAIRRFFGYLRRGHETAISDEDTVGGRWGSDDPSHKTRLARGAASSTVLAYYRTLRTFLTWCIKEDAFKHCGDISPMEKVERPVHRDSQTQPFTEEQVRALVEAARKTSTRDYAICLLLLDTGIRVSELVALSLDDIDLNSMQIVVRRGKGNKSRVVPFSNDTRRALNGWLRTYNPQRLVSGGRANGDSNAASVPLFRARRGLDAGKGLSHRGFEEMIRRWADRAGITGVRCSPHTFRHTFAVMFLREGGNAFTLQKILGHTSFAMTSKYVALAQADINRQHAQFSPVAALRKGGAR